MAKVQAASTQEHVPIAGVRNGIIILKDGSYRLILSVSPINFSLKSEQEQNSIIFKYQSFLNSLHFPIQITMQSKKLDLTPYLTKMKKGLESQQNELVKMQTEDYISFVGQLINVANIMSKTFFVSVSHLPLSLPKLGFFDKLMGRTVQSNVLRISDADFKANSDEVLEKGNIVASGLGSIGLVVQQLNTQEILEMYYNLYNPEEAGKERLLDIEQLQSPVVIDKNEATVSQLENASEEAPIINNKATVEEANKRQKREREVAALQEKEKQAAAAQSAAQPPKAAAPAPIQQRLEANAQANTQAAAAEPEAPAMPDENPQPTPPAEPPAALQDDNVNIK